MEDSYLKNALLDLETAAPSSFCDLDRCAASVGVYTLWHKEAFLYVGICRTDPGKTKNPQAQGVRGRLGSYRDGKLNEVFTVNVLLRFVVPNLSDEERSQLSQGVIGTKQMSERVREFVNKQITYRICLMDDDKTAGRIERFVRINGLPNAGKPAFNPQ